MIPRVASRLRWISVLGVSVLGVVAGCDDAAPGIDTTVNFELAMSSLDRVLTATPPTGRMPGTNRAIAELVRDQFREVGVEDVTIEDFSIPVSASTNHHLTFAGAGSLDGEHAHEVNVFGGDGLVNAAGLVDFGLAMEPIPAAAGKVALLDFSVTRSLRTQYRNVVDSGAVGAIIDSKIDALRQRNVWTLADADQIDGPIPIVTIDQAAAAAVRQELARGADVRVDLATDATVTPMTAYNVIARIPGTTHPERTLIVNAHLDSWFTGAADDAQAVAALVALAKVFHDNPMPYTLELIAFDCEETFLLGSNNYIMRRLPAVRDTLIGAISLEMLAPKNQSLSVVTLDAKDAWLPAVEAGGLTDMFRITFSPDDLMTAFGGEVPSDQGNFWQFGVPGFLVVTSYNEYHTALDNAENTDERRYEKVLLALERTMRELGKLSPEALADRPNSSIHVQPTLGERTAGQITGSIATSNAQTTIPITDAVVTVTMYNATYDTIITSASATFVPGTGYAFSIDYDFVPGTTYILSFDALIAGHASGRALLRI